MKKLFLLICSVFCIIHTHPSQASVRDVMSLDDNTYQEENDNISNKPIEMPSPDNENEVREFFKKRFEMATKTPAMSSSELHNKSGLNIIHTDEYYKMKDEENKSTFQKIYESALKSIKNNNTAEQGPASSSQSNNNKTDEMDSDTRFFTLVQNEQTEPQENIPTVAVKLPLGKTILVPANEHIPYIISYIDIKANGYVKIEDTIIIVANNNKFQYGLSRYFPRYTIDTKGKQHRINFMLENVSVNDKNIPYKATEIGNDILLEPIYNRKLEPGVYTYKFSYILNNVLINAGENILLDWNLTGRPMNALITSANAIINMPSGHTFTDFASIIGKPGKLYSNRTNVYQLSKNTLAFSNINPVFNGENMNLIVAMNKNAFLNNFDKEYNNFIYDWGNELYTGICFCIVFLSLLISVFQIKNDQKNSKFNHNYTSDFMRTILIGKYDKLAFISKIIDFYSKGIIDITKENEKIYLIAKNIKSNKINKVEKKSLKKIFTKKLNKVELSNKIGKQIIQAKNLLEHSVNKKIKNLRFTHNIGYIIFSMCLLLLSEFFIAINSINIIQTMVILISSTLIYIFYVWILRYKFKSVLLSMFLKLFALIVITATWFVCSVYIGVISELLIIATIYMISKFANIFDTKNSYINNAKTTISKFKEHLTTNSETINVSKTFSLQQANICALNITDSFPKNKSNEKVYVLDLIDTMKQSLIGII